jgi:predicted RNA-binding Zn-ribbon protein involved in translation (DUF1610 family)
MARRRKKLSPLQRRLQNICFGFMVVGGMAALVLLLPIILPVVAISDVLEERRLARFKCLTCGEPLGREEIRRAKREAVIEGRPWGGPMDNIRRRVVSIWQMICPTCGHRYTYRPSQPHATMESQVAGAGGRAA